jgi:hypothetical protein
MDFCAFKKDDERPDETGDDKVFRKTPRQSGKGLEAMKFQDSQGKISTGCKESRRAATKRA